MSGNSRYPFISLSKVLVQDKEYVTELEPRLYPKLSVKLYGRGVVLDEPTNGAAVRMKRHQLAQPRQVILSEIWAKKGAIGIVPDEGAGALATSHFFLFDVDESRLLRSYMGWLLSANYFEPVLSGEARGTTGYAAVRPKQFLQCEIPLPPLDEQRRIVARIEKLAAKVEAARALREQATREVELLMMQVSSQLLGDRRWEIRLLETVLAEQPRNGLSPQRKVEQGGRPMLRISAVSSSPTRFVDMTAHVMVDASDAQAQPFVLQHDDVFVVRYNADINRVAKAAVFKSTGSCNAVYPDKLIRLRANQEEITSDFLVYALGARDVRAQIESLAKTTAGQIGISGANIRSLQIPVPPISEQHRIVAYLDDLQARVGAVTVHQVATAAALDTLLPSILDRAFKGEL